MKKREYLEAMHRLYRYIYSHHGDKDSYTFQDGSAVVKSFLIEFPKAFTVDEKAYKSAYDERGRLSFCPMFERSGCSGTQAGPEARF